VVEAHGTGTTLGDPIEAQAVLATYGRDRPVDRPLWLGSVKSNLGHTQSAAGAAGVMKMVLALQHQELPLSLHADEPAHNIDWSAGHVELLAEARPWPVNGRPRRAGVSSFGISGTNAHLILEEPPGDSAAPSPDGANGAAGAPADRAAVLLDAPPAWLLSGRTAGALAAQAGRLVAWVRGREDVAPVDVSWSLATTRSAFEHRAVVLGSDLAELLSGATAVAGGESAANVLAGTVPANRSARVGFLFAGQGAQRAGMGRELYAASPAFAAAFDRAVELLEAELGLPIREVVLGAPEGDPGAAPDLGDDLEARRADQTVFAQTGLFALEVGLVAVLAEAGIVPDVVAGHSVGEIAAAHAAGVLSLEDACSLVAARARLMQDMPPGGAMAAVAASESELLAELDGMPGVSLAAVNGPTSVVISGEDVAVEGFVRRWLEQGRRARRLRVSHAFHSYRMDPVLPDLGEVAAGLEHRTPAVSWVGALSGALVDLPEAGYWTAQARQPVRFADAVSAMAELSVSVFIEIGPDGTLSGMASTAHSDPDTGENPGDRAEFIPLLRPNTPAATSVCAALGRAHVRGVSVDWPALLPAGRRIDLPTYAFTRKRFWIGTGTTPAEMPAGSGTRTETTGEARFWAAVEGGDVRALAHELAVADQERLDGVMPMLASWRRREREDSVTAGWRYAISWTRVPDPVSAVMSGVWLVVVGRAEQAGDYVRALTVHGAEPVVVEVATGELDRGAIAARVGQALDGVPAVTGVVSLLALEPEPSRRHPVVAAGLAGTLGLVQALGDLGVAAPLWVLTRGAVTVGEGDVLTEPILAQVWGLGRVVGLEHPNRWGGLIDLPQVLDGRAAERLCSVLAGAGPGFEDQVAIRGTGILGRRLVRADPARGRGARWTPRGTVLVTGGSGALGGHAARWAASRGADRIAVASRSGANAPGVAQLAADLAEAGASVAVLAGDVGARDDVDALLKWVAASGPGLTAVFHAAGVAEATLIDQADLAGVAAVLAAKVGGALWLDQLTAELDLAQFVVFSSISSTWGSGAQPGYAAGNAFLDALIENRLARGLVGTSVAWGPWGGAGMADSDETRAGLLSRGLRFLDGDRGIAALASVVDSGGGAITVADVDWARFAEVFTLLRPSPLIADLPEVREACAGSESEDAAHEATALTHQLAGRSPAEQDRILVDLVRTEAAVVLGHTSIESVAADQAFKDLGFDSLTAVEIRNRLNIATGERLPATAIFDYPNPVTLARYLNSLLVSSAGGSDTENAEDVELRKVISSVPLSVLRKVGLLESLLELANAADGTAEPDQVDVSIEEMDVTDLIRMARDRASSGDLR
ncbi:MAG TPA: type I polyketide synthase, partial [Pseudonocardia sp.]|uniref:type I polyketide synthase n=1 Tax=Pseudonocardia sp. TaxID=60912 RepID=UPI002B868AF1